MRCLVLSLLAAIVLAQVGYAAPDEIDLQQRQQESLQRAEQDEDVALELGLKLSLEAYEHETKRQEEESITERIAMEESIEEENERVEKDRQFLELAIKLSIEDITKNDSAIAMSL
jgi:hypothetical protein